MADGKIAYASPSALTIDLAGLAASATAGQESTAFVNTTNKYLDYAIRVRIKPANSGTIGPGIFLVYLYTAIDEAAYDDAMTGSNSARTPYSEDNLYLLGIISGLALNTTIRRTFGLKRACGFMPTRAGVWVRNGCTSTALSATAGDHDISIEGRYSTVG